MKHNLQAFKKYYSNASKDEVIEDMFLDCCTLQNRIDEAIIYIKSNKKEWIHNDYDVTLYYSLDSEECSELLKILKGEENE